MRTTYTTLGDEATPSTERSTSPGNLHRRPSLLSAGPWVGGHLCSGGHPDFLPFYFSYANQHRSVPAGVGC